MFKIKNEIMLLVLVTTIINILIGNLSKASSSNISKNELNSPYKKENISEHTNATHFKLYNNTCMTKGCIEAAFEILKNMDKKINPCDNFYEFACGNFIEKTHIPDDKVSVTQFTVIDDLLMDQLKEIVDEPPMMDDLKPFTMAKSLYNCCMDHEKIEKLGLTPMKNELRRLGGWPVLEDNWNEDLFSWQEMIYKLREEGSNFELFIDLSVTIDMKKSTTRVIDIDEPCMGLEREYLIQGFAHRIVDGYYKYMIEIAVVFGADRNRAAEELKQSLQFEIDLANITLPREERRDARKLYNPMKIIDVQHKFPFIPWLKYINTLMAQPNLVTENETIVISSPKYLAGLEKLLSVTPKRVIANYLLWRTVASSIFFLNKEARDEQLKFHTIVAGMKSREPRWKECLNLVMGTYSISMGSLYVRRYFKQDSRRTALLMVEGIRQQMYKTLDSVDWMDDFTKKIALNKARAMINHIGYPDELFEDDKILKFYEKLTVDQNEYFDSLKNVSRFWTNYLYSQLRKPVNKTDWTTHCEPAVVNAFYNPMENSIQFPAGILQHIFFSHDRPQYLNYGGIGFIMSHEITHGFDDEGRQFDKNGNLVEWWSPETKKRFEDKAQCFIEQSNNFSPKGIDMKLKGINVQGEVIADNGGIRNAYYAYLEYVKKNGDEPKLPNLREYTSQQMFWLGAANVWCAKYRPETTKVNIETGYHPPCEFRILGSFTNQDEFARDFNCPVGSKMNPAKKCKAW